MIQEGIEIAHSYTAAEVAGLLRCSKGFVYTEIRTGKLRAAKLNDRGDLRVLGAWVIQYLEALAQREVA